MGWFIIVVGLVISYFIYRASRREVVNDVDKDIVDVPGWAVALITVVMAGAVGGAVAARSGASNYSVSNSSQAAHQSEVATALSAEAFKAKAETIPFKELEKSAERYKGKILTYTGEVVQIQEKADSTHVRMAVAQGKYGYDWDSIILVFYPGPMDKAYKGSIIQIWGLCDGEYTYESQAGWNITVPLIRAKYWSLIQQESKLECFGCSVVEKNMENPNICANEA